MTLYPGSIQDVRNSDIIRQSRVVLWLVCHVRDISNKNCQLKFIVFLWKNITSFLEKLMSLKNGKGKLLLAHLLSEGY